MKQSKWISTMWISLVHCVICGLVKWRCEECDISIIRERTVKGVSVEAYRIPTTASNINVPGTPWTSQETLRTQLYPTLSQVLHLQNLTHDRLDIQLTTLLHYLTMQSFLSTSALITLLTLSSPFLSLVHAAKPSSLTSSSAAATATGSSSKTDSLGSTGSSSGSLDSGAWSQSSSSSSSASSSSSTASAKSQWFVLP